ncbi:DUF998 domain-containing protein [Pseudoduganella sp. OTU4001]|uniref:DUF998 domain-containing protein n=1 Tax=Pseudoduganella sp. OTU4001 TaxID=3043854 RepID=UPI00313B1233
MNIIAAQFVSVAVAAYLAAACAVLGRRKAGYSHWAHTISELGEQGARDQRLVAFGMFLPVGLLLLAVAGLMWREQPHSARLALCIAVGYIGAAFFPCDPGSPGTGSPRQALHNLAGGVEYVGGGLALIAMAPRHGPLTQWCGVIVLGSGFLIGVMPSTGWRGALQRVAESCLFGGLAFSLWWAYL